MERMLRLLGLALIALPILALPGPAQADIVVSLAHGKLHLPVPDGYCEVDTDLALESALFDLEAKTFEGRARLLAMTADCGELAAFRQRHTSVTRILSFVLALKGDEGARRPDAERTQFLDGLAHQFGKAEAKDYATSAQQWWNLEDPAAQVQSFGLAERDSSAVYLRAVRLIGRHDPAPIAGISAVTLVDGYEVAANFYMHADEHGLPGLLALAEHESQALVAANKPPPTPAMAGTPAPTLAANPPAGADDAQLPSLGALLGQSSSTLIVIAGAVLVVSFLMLSSRRSSRQKTTSRR